MCSLREYKSREWRGLLIKLYQTHVVKINPLTNAFWQSYALLICLFSLTNLVLKFWCVCAWYSVTSLDQSEASIQVTWSLSANQRPLSRSRDNSQPIRGQYPGQVITLDQSEATISLLGQVALWSIKLVRLQFAGDLKFPHFVAILLMRDSAGRRAECAELRGWEIFCKISGQIVILSKKQLTNSKSGNFFPSKTWIN